MLPPLPEEVHPLSSQPANEIHEWAPHFLRSKPRNDMIKTQMILNYPKSLNVSKCPGTSWNYFHCEGTRCRYPHIDLRRLRSEKGALVSPDLPRSNLTAKTWQNDDITSIDHHWLMWIWGSSTWFLKARGRWSTADLASNRPSLKKPIGSRPHDSRDPNPTSQQSHGWDTHYGWALMGQPHVRFRQRFFLFGSRPRPNHANNNVHKYAMQSSCKLSLLFPAACCYH